MSKLCSAGRPHRDIAAAREFGALVEGERKPYDKLESTFIRVQRRDPRRWRSMSTMYRLWRLFHADKDWQRLRGRIAELEATRERTNHPAKATMLDMEIELLNFRLVEEAEKRKKPLPKMPKTPAERAVVIAKLLGPRGGNNPQVVAFAERAYLEGQRIALKIISDSRNTL
jgi:hypothetical protein